MVLLLCGQHSHASCNRNEIVFYIQFVLSDILYTNGYIQVVVSESNQILVRE